ncbi:hypothetical protein DL546_003882 [Coniochaeta pulveracea]|uniref:Uncharacterized protein n=1 Tax=Coniochaeta pulveracea TaxID=177199 RepID=A0A420Y1T1_9PEZI|nr:hypothetical protein DL546_003882 [Coniochaeta pulveracea]
MADHHCYSELQSSWITSKCQRQQQLLDVLIARSSCRPTTLAPTTIATLSFSVTYRLKTLAPTQILNPVNSGPPPRLEKVQSPVVDNHCYSTASAVTDIHHERWQSTVEGPTAVLNPVNSGPPPRLEKV